jgi:hypothetical protein
MDTKKESCCVDVKAKCQKQGIGWGILCGFFPHTFCIASIIFSVIGAAMANTYLRRILLIPNFFSFLILFSLLIASFSAATYLKKIDCLCISGIKSKWKYLTALYSSTIIVNLAMFFIIFPVLANINSNQLSGDVINSAELSMRVELPCTGHAPLVMEEIKKNRSIQGVKFTAPDTFQIKYNPQETSPAKIASLEIFKTFEVTLN